MGITQNVIAMLYYWTTTSYFVDANFNKYECTMDQELANAAAYAPGRRCVLISKTILPNFIPIRFETAKQAFYRAMHFSAKRGIAIVHCPSVCLSLCVTFRYRDHIGWNSSKIISRPNSLRPLLGLILTWAIWCNGNTPKIGAE